VRPELRVLGKLAGVDVRLRTMAGVHCEDGLVPFSIGERVMHASVREAGVDNGDTGTVRGITGAVLHVEREDGRLVTIDTRTEDGAMIQHASVRVECGLQGRTLEATVQHFGANVSRRSAYTGASRHEAEYHAVMSREVFPEDFEKFVLRASRIVRQGSRDGLHRPGSRGGEARGAQATAVARGKNAGAKRPPGWRKGTS
jgi:hypothetical protein